MLCRFYCYKQLLHLCVFATVSPVEREYYKNPQGIDMNTVVHGKNNFSVESKGLEATFAKSWGKGTGKVFAFSDRGKN